MTITNAEKQQNLFLQSRGRVKTTSALGKRAWDWLKLLKLYKKMTPMSPPWLGIFAPFQCSCLSPKAHFGPVYTTMLAGENDKIFHQMGLSFRQRQRFVLFFRHLLLPLLLLHELSYRNHPNIKMLNSLRKCRPCIQVFSNFLNWIQLKTYIFTNVNGRNLQILFKLLHFQILPLLHTFSYRLHFEFKWVMGDFQHFNFF